MAAEAGASQPAARVESSQDHVIAAATDHSSLRGVKDSVERLIPGSGKKSGYNTKSLGPRLAADGAAAATAGVLVAPIITMIDQ